MASLAKKLVQVCTHARKSLSNETIILQARRQGFLIWHPLIVDSVFEQSDS